MEVQLINKGLLAESHRKTASSESLRMNLNLRTTPEDGAQRKLNALEVGLCVPIHRHEETSETVVCLQGRLDFKIRVRNLYDVLIRIVFPDPAVAPDFYMAIVEKATGKALATL